MKIESLASSSSGNCYIIDDSKTRLMIEAGLSYTEIKERLNFDIPKYCLISHSHKDHSMAVKDLLRSGVNCYMSAETSIELEVDEHYRCHTLTATQQQKIGTFIVKPLLMNHDVHCFGFLIYSTVNKETIFFATDTYMIQYKVDSVDYVMVEANYDVAILNEKINDGSLPLSMRTRLMKSHMEIQTLANWIRKQNRKTWKHIYLLHMSTGNCDLEQTKRLITGITGKPVTVFEE